MICEKSTIKLGVWLESIHSILNFKVQETSFYESWYIYIQFSSEQKKRQVVGILKKEGIVGGFLQLSSRLR